MSSQNTVLPWTTLPTTWKGSSIYIIGGGPSLVGMDWNLLKGQIVIGCNDAYLLGPDITRLCFFGDAKWYRFHQAHLAGYDGFKVTSEKTLWNEPGLVYLKRAKQGWALPDLGWYMNTGASAVALAIGLGAAKIVLLGFDMKLGPNGQNDWHPNVLDEPNPEVFHRFKKNFQLLADDVQASGNPVRIINANLDSELTMFPKVPLRRIMDQLLYQRIYDHPALNYGRAEHNRCPGYRFLPLYKDWLLDPVFDFGCGTGDTVLAIRQQGLSANGMDQIKWKNGMLVGDICSPLDDGIRYRSAICMDVTEHLCDEDLAGLFVNLGRAERQVISVHCGPAPQKGLDKPVDLHINRKTIEEWTAFIARWFVVDTVIPLQTARYLLLCHKKDVVTADEKHSG